MSALQSPLPGLFGPSSQQAVFDGLATDRAIVVGAEILFSAIQTCAVQAGCIDRVLQKDPRFKTALTQAMTLSMGVNAQTQGFARDRCAFLQKHIRDRGLVGLAGKLAWAAYRLGRMAQDLNTKPDLTHVLAIIDEAIALRAILNDANPSTARAQHQVQVMNLLNKAKRSS